jgi:signal transduction histidine kinase
LVNKKGEKKLITAALSRIEHPRENKISEMALFYDMTELREYQEQVKRHQRIKELGEMSAGVAHEIRNPLNAISMAVQRLREEIADAESEDVRKLLNHLLSETKRLNNIVEDFLLFARYTHRPGVSDLKETVESTIDLLKPQADKLNVTLNYSISDNAKLKIHKEELIKVLMNLIVNALHSCKKGGEVNIKAERVSGYKVILEVEDNGIGIPDEILDNIFQPYVSSKKGGTGLGLSIVMRIITDAGGTIKAENRPEGGAIFTMILPEAV